MLKCWNLKNQFLKISYTIYRDIARNRITAPFPLNIYFTISICWASLSPMDIPKNVEEEPINIWQKQTHLQDLTEKSLKHSTIKTTGWGRWENKTGSEIKQSHGNDS